MYELDADVFVRCPPRNDSYRTIAVPPFLVQLGTPPVVTDEHVGHEDGSIGARYSYVTQEMVRRLLDG